MTLRLTVSTTERKSLGPTCSLFLWLNGRGDSQELATLLYRLYRLWIHRTQDDSLEKDVPIVKESTSRVYTLLTG